eukprot:scaffold6528_cov114-Cylindrotheca_fusiformis.AAC.13
MYGITSISFSLFHHTISSAQETVPQQTLLGIVQTNLIPLLTLPKEAVNPKILFYPPTTTNQPEAIADFSFYRESQRTLDSLEPLSPAHADATISATISIALTNQNQWGRGYILRQIWNPNGEIVCFDEEPKQLYGPSTKN